MRFYRKCVRLRERTVTSFCFFCIGTRVLFIIKAALIFLCLSLKQYVDIVTSECKTQVDSFSIQDQKTAFLWTYHTASLRLCLLLSIYERYCGHYRDRIWLLKGRAPVFSTTDQWNHVDGIWETL